MYCLYTVLYYTILYDTIFFNPYIEETNNNGVIHMKTLIDNESGTLVFIPQSASDKNLLYHLLNCADITQFTEYLKAEQQLGAHAVTNDIGVSVEEFTGYPMTVGTDTRYDRSPLSTMQPMNVLPDFESLIQFDITKTLIGFSRDSS